jgi:hypothetical protein
LQPSPVHHKTFSAGEASPKPRPQIGICGYAEVCLSETLRQAAQDKGRAQDALGEVGGEIRCPDEKQDDEEGGDRPQAEPVRGEFPSGVAAAVLALEDDAAQSV